MEAINKITTNLLTGNGLVMAFIYVGVIMWVSGLLAKATKGRIASSAIAIFIGLVIAYIGGSMVAGGKKGISDVALFAGVGVLGGNMLRDYAIISTAYGAKLSELAKAGLAGLLALLTGLVGCFAVAAVIAYLFGYTDAKEVTTIAAGAATFIVGPVTADALGVSSDIKTLSVAAGVVKSVVVMIATPMLAKPFGLTNPQAAMIYGGLMGTTSGTAAGMAATDPRLVPYCAVVATFYTGFGCLLCPSVLYFIVNAIL